jgi:hypothetical protein
LCNYSTELRGEGKENDRASTISKNITSVKAEDVTIHIKSY